MRFGYLTLLMTAVFLCIAEVLGWNLLAYSRLHTAPDGTNPIGQVRFILGNPIVFSTVLATDIWIHGFEYLRNWIAIYGYAYWPVPALTYYLYSIGLLVVLPASAGDTLDKRTRIGLGVVFVIAYLATIVSLYLTFTPVGSRYVEGVQGRYFVTVMPLLFLALACLPRLTRIRIPSHLPAIFGVASLIAYIAGMYLSYHVPCGSQFYQSGLCYQPNYKNWAPDERYSPPVSNQLTLSQEIVPECNGMTALRIWVNSVGSVPNGTTQFTLMDVDKGREVASIYISNSELPNGDWYSLSFRSDWASSGKFYLLKIQGDQSGNTGPRIAYSLRPEYPAGKLYENDQALGQDMIFQIGCIAGWDKLRSTNTP
jgi:hypothetical protein